MAGTPMNGEQFNHWHAGQMAIKLTFDDHIHNGFEYNMGLNVDRNVFATYAPFNSGMFFAFEEDIPKWLFNGTVNRMHRWAWTVAIPNDAKVVVYANRVKCDRFILSDPRPISTLKWPDQQYDAGMVLKYVSAAAFIPNLSTMAHDIAVSKLIYMVDCQGSNDGCSLRGMYKSHEMIVYMPLSIQLAIAEQKPEVILNKDYYDRFPKEVQMAAPKKHVIN